MNNMLLSGCAPHIYPTELHEGFLSFTDGNFLDVPPKFPFQSEWGECISNNIPLIDNDGMPIRFNAIWLSIIEKKFYITSLEFPVSAMADVWNQSLTDGNPMFSHLVFGMAPFGFYVLWFYGYYKSIVIAIDTADEVPLDMKAFLPQSPEMKLNEYCDYYFKTLPEIKNNFDKNGLPPRDLFDNYMKQFTYRYLVVFEKWNENDEKWVKYEEDEVLPEFEYIEEKLYDGTHDKLHDGGLMKYHEAGKPKKLAVKWHIKKSEYSAYFWFDDNGVRTVFDKFYGAHPDTKTDFIIKIDPGKRKYELSLYRYGLKEPVTIPEEAYQLIVFKNKFEDYRSDNYNQESGAWIW